MNFAVNTLEYKFYPISIHLSIFAHRSIHLMFMHFTANCSKQYSYPKYYSMPIINFKICLQFFFPCKTYIQWYTQTLSVHTMSFDKWILLCTQTPLKVKNISITFKSSFLPLFSQSLPPPHPQRQPLF